MFVKPVDGVNAYDFLLYYIPHYSNLDIFISVQNSEEECQRTE